MKRIIAVVFLFVVFIVGTQGTVARRDDIALTIAVDPTIVALGSPTQVTATVSVTGAQAINFKEVDVYALDPSCVGGARIDEVIELIRHRIEAGSMLTLTADYIPQQTCGGSDFVAELKVQVGGQFYAVTTPLTVTQ